MPTALPVLSYRVKVVVKSPDFASSLYTSTEVWSTAESAVMRRGLPPFQATRPDEEWVVPTRRNLELRLGQLQQEPEQHIPPTRQEHALAEEDEELRQRMAAMEERFQQTLEKMESGASRKERTEEEGVRLSPVRHVSPKRGAGETGGAEPASELAELRREVRELKDQCMQALQTHLWRGSGKKYDAIAQSLPAGSSKSLEKN